MLAGLVIFIIDELDKINDQDLTSVIKSLKLLFNQSKGFVDAIIKALLTIELTVDKSYNDSVACTSFGDLRFDGAENNTFAWAYKYVLKVNNC